MSVTATPAWLLEGEVGLCPCGCIGRRRKGSYLDRTIRGAADVLRRAMFSDDMAVRPGLLQRVDPRVKLVTVLALLVATAFVRHIPVLLIVDVAAVALAAASRLPVGLVLKRVWLFVPIFTGIVVLPATLNLITAGKIVVPLGTWFGHPVGMTSQGWTSAGLIVTRVAASISLLVLLTLTTPWNRLLASVRSLGVPKLFVLVLGMAHRYVFELLGSVTDMYEARKARTVQLDTGAVGGRRFVAASAGALLGRSHALTEEVHQAMVARGLHGRRPHAGPVTVASRRRPLGDRLGGDRDRGGGR